MAKIVSWLSILSSVDKLYSYVSVVKCLPIFLIFAFATTACGRIELGPLKGVNDSSGGDQRQLADKEIEQEIKKIWSQMPEALFRLKTISEDLDKIQNERGPFDPPPFEDYFRKSESLQVMDVFLKRVDNASSFVSNYKLRIQEPHCETADGARSGAYSPDGTICLSVKGLKGLSGYALKVEIFALIIHEMAHRFEVDHSKIYKIQEAAAKNAYNALRLHTINEEAIKEKIHLILENYSKAMIISLIQSRSSKFSEEFYKENQEAWQLADGAVKRLRGEVSRTQLYNESNREWNWILSPYLLKSLTVGEKHLVYKNSSKPESVDPEKLREAFRSLLNATRNDAFLQLSKKDDFSIFHFRIYDSVVQALKSNGNVPLESSPMKMSCKALFKDDEYVGQAKQDWVETHLFYSSLTGNIIASKEDPLQCMELEIVFPKSKDGSEIDSLFLIPYSKINFDSNLRVFDSDLRLIQNLNIVAPNFAKNHLFYLSPMPTDFRGRGDLVLMIRGETKPIRFKSSYNGPTYECNF